MILPRCVSVFDSPLFNVQVCLSVSASIDLNYRLVYTTTSTSANSELVSGRVTQDRQVFRMTEAAGNEGIALNPVAGRSRK